jgi:hypothetical protein
MRFAGIVFALTAFAVVVSPTRALADDEPATTRTDDDRARFSAAFRFAGSSSEEAARRAAIDRGIDSLFFAIRGIARSRLSAGTKIDPWVAFSFEADKIRVRAPSSDAISPANGTAVDYGNGDDKSKLSQRISTGRIVQAFIAGEGRRVNEWVLSPDARTLSLKVTVSSPKLTRPVIYTLTYERTR